MGIMQQTHVDRATESQRALELRKFFAPYRQATEPMVLRSNESLTSDGALAAYSENVIWRLGSTHAMVSLIDRTEQYFVAGAIRKENLDRREVSEEVVTEPTWFGCSTVPTPGGLCENTIAIDASNDAYPCFVINDLSKDERFKKLPVVDGSVASYRFYAGTPITTDNGINIGSFFVFDDQPRDGLSLAQRKFLRHQATNVMRHLQTKREANERRRVALMSRGIANFLDRTARIADLSPATPSPREAASSTVPVEVFAKEGSRQAASEVTPTSAEKSVLDRIRLTLDFAADILRESLELVAGGVVFLDTAVGHTDASVDIDQVNSNGVGHDVERTDEEKKGEHSRFRATFSSGENQVERHLSQGLTRDSTDEYRASKVLAMSAAHVATWDSQSKFLDRKTLNTLIKLYPTGNIWYIDDGGSFSSLEQVNGLERSSGISPSGKRRSIPRADLARHHAEATMLSRLFHKARQIIFVPLWDAGGGGTLDALSGASLSSFTNSVMVEISRLDAITTSKMKSDFISSISHEFRSPLHGILASSEFLRESLLDAEQIEYISTIQNCSGTLLDTINHVLDYSKINSFESASNQKGTISNELYHTTDIALLCEDIINGMIAANEFHGTGSTDYPLPISIRSSRTTHSLPNAQPKVNIILDIEHADWNFRVQAGALRRVIMNVFGNSQKYTKSGFIVVQLGLQQEPPNSSGMRREVISLHIRDTGKGMSSEYMERRLYHPFSQEDSFSPGIGLGLSIVWSVINQIGGKIRVRSELGKGTDVEITLPLERGDEVDEVHTRPGSLTKISTEHHEAIKILRERVVGRRVLLSYTKQNNNLHDTGIAWKCIAKYCSEWFGFHVVEGSSEAHSADLIITKEYERLDIAQLAETPDQRILVIHEDMNCNTKYNQGRVPTASICNPIGPFKLARCILALLDQNVSKWTKKCTDAGTQTPDEPNVSRGDYGFTLPATVPASPLELPKSGSATEGSQTTPCFDGDNRRNFQGLTLPTRKTTSSTTISAPQEPSTPLHILAVDDNALNLQLIHRFLLKRKEDTIVTARNGREAVEATRKSLSERKRFDVVFMDISMPEIDGFEATRLIRGLERTSQAGTISRNDPEKGADSDEGVLISRDDIYSEGLDGNSNGAERRDAYIVALTGLASRRDRDEAEESGFDEFLTKPVSFGKIGELLKRLSFEKKDVS